MNYPSIAQNAAAVKARKKQAKTKRLSKLPIDVIFEYASQRDIMNALSSVLKKIKRPFALQYGPTNKQLYYIRRESSEFKPRSFRTTIVPRSKPTHMQTWIVSGRLKKTGTSAIHKIGIPIQRVEGIIKKMWLDGEVSEDVYRRYFYAPSKVKRPTAEVVTKKKKASRKPSKKKVVRKKASKKKATKKAAKKKKARKKASSVSAVEKAVKKFEAFVEKESRETAANAPYGGQITPDYSVTQIAPVQFNPAPFGGQITPDYSVTQIAPVQFNPSGTRPWVTPPPIAGVLMSNKFIFLRHEPGMAGYPLSGPRDIWGEPSTLLREVHVYSMPSPRWYITTPDYVVITFGDTAQELQQALLEHYIFPPPGVGQARPANLRKLMPNPLLMTIYPNPGPDTERAQEIQAFTKNKGKKKTTRNGAVGKTKHRKFMSNPRRKKKPITMTVREYENYLDAHGTDDQKARYYEAKEAYRRFHKGAEPQQITRFEEVIGDPDSDVTETEFEYALGASPAEIYNTPEHSNKPTYSYIHDYEELPQLTTTAGGRRVTKRYQGTKTRVTDWIHG